MTSSFKFASKSRDFLTLNTSRVTIVALVATGAVLMMGPPGYAASPAVINLGSSNSFAVLADTYIATGATSTINGDIGAGAAITTGASSVHAGSLYAGAAITTGANNVIEGSLYALAAITNGAGTVVDGSQDPGQRSRSSSYVSAMTDSGAAMADASRRTATEISPALGGTTLRAGVYSTSDFFTLTGTVTLDAQGDANAVFIIRSPSYIVTAANSTVNLANGAQAKNVFWVARSYITLGADSLVQGNMLATGYVSLGADTSVQGRIFSQSSYVLFGTSGPRSTFGVAGIGTTSTSGVIPSLTPAVSSSTPTSGGFTFSITNYDGSYTWSGTATNGGIVTINSSGLGTVTGLAPNTSSTATVTAKKIGASDGSKTVSATSLAAGLNAELTPTFSSSTPTSGGFTFIIPNYDGSYTWSGTATNGGIVTINSSGLGTVTGVLPNTSSTATIIATKTGAPTGSNTLSATSSAAGSNNHTPKPDGFTFNIPNYDGSYTWSGTATNGGIVTIDSSGLVTVKGLKRGTSSTVTITSTKAGFPTFSQTMSGASLARSPQKITVGSFKGYVAVYAMGYEGQRLSAKIGNDWVIVPSIPAAENSVFRWVEPTGFGVDCKVRVFIDRVLVETVFLTTK